VSALALVVVVWVLAALGMGGAFLYARARRNMGYVDVFWALGMALAALLVALLAGGDPLVRLLVAAFGGLWGLRLFHFLWKRVAGEAEDGRYRAMRDAIGDGPWRWFAFFQLQALVIALFALPFVAAASAPGGPTSVGVWIAVAVWMVAVGGESLADHQLLAHRRDPAQRGRTCRRGLWAWSRHPNYFFEWLHWFAYVALAAAGPLGWLAWTGPVLMLAFLWRVSGIPWTEAQALRTRGEDYRRYQAEVSAFFPWPPTRRAPGTDTHRLARKDP
jgi:steroid 5-alpha reductase family enzyme